MSRWPARAGGFAWPLLLALVTASCAAREWAGEESGRIESVMGTAEETADEQAFEGVASPRELSPTEKPAPEAKAKPAQKERPKTVRKRPQSSRNSGAKSKRDEVGRATDLESLMRK